MFRLLTLFLLQTLALFAMADTFAIDTAALRLPLGVGVEYLEDRSGHLDLRTVKEAGHQWQRGEHDVFNQGYSDSAWWLRFSLLNNSQRPLQRRLEISYAVLDHIDIYQIRQNGSIAILTMGDKLPYHERPVDHRFFLVPVLLPAEESLEIYIRVKTGSSVQVPMTLWEQEAFAVFDTDRTIIQGAYYGVMFVIVIYNLLMFGVWRDATFLFYAGYVISMPMFLASLTGQSFRYLWPHATVWNDQSIVIFLAGVVAFGGLFIRKMLNLARISTFWDRTFIIFSYLGFIAAGLAFLITYNQAIRLLVPMTSAVCLAAMVVGIYAWRRGQPTAPYFTLAWISLLSGGLTLAMSKHGILPANALTEYATQIGSAIEVILLTVALAERINVERQMRFEAQAATLRIQLQVNEELEQRVHDRTNDLQEANLKLQTLSNTDQLTGLRNRRHLDHALEQEWNRCKRYHHSLAILMIDIDHFKAVNDNYGHSTGDDCLRAIAQRLNTCLRKPSDQVARYGGEEFCIILPETDSHGAATVAERARLAVAEQPVCSGETALQITISIGISVVIPAENLTLQRHINEADEALYEAKKTGRNRYFTSKITPHT